MTALSDLIARLDAAKDGSRELDALVGISINGVGGAKVRHYTTSLDAALTLVPEGWFWRCGNGDGFPARAEQWANVFRGNYREEKGRAATVPLALVIAALKAREARR